MDCLKTFQLEICGVLVKLHLKAEPPLEKQTTQTISLSIYIPHVSVVNFCLITDEFWLQTV